MPRLPTIVLALAWMVARAAAAAANPIAIVVPPDLASPAATPSNPKPEVVLARAPFRFFVVSQTPCSSSCFLAGPAAARKQRIEIANITCSASLSAGAQGVLGYAVLRKGAQQFLGLLPATVQATVGSVVEVTNTVVSLPVNANESMLIFVQSATSTSTFLQCGFTGTLVTLK